jgi:hypothetical protein
MEKIITYFNQPAKVACDEKCNKAWGVNSRPRVYLSEKEDDYEMLSDDELPDAPLDPGTYEGGHAKPATPLSAPNKWCVRECERCARSRRGRHGDKLELPDFSQRRRNLPS